MTEIVPDDFVAKAVTEELQRQLETGREAMDWQGVLACAGVGRRQVERLFRAAYFTSPARFFADLKAHRAAALLKDGHDVLSAAVLSGHSSAGRLHDATIQRHGMTPGEMRNRGAGVRIDYGVFDTPLSAVLMAATSRGLCALRLLTLRPAEEHLKDLRGEFPAATFSENATALQDYADQLVHFLEAKSELFNPRIDVHGTAFQREVFAELQKIKVGETVTYAELARRLGRPKSARAVGQACGKNPLAIAIPCHRVLASGGQLNGYRWGPEWKERLLRLEAEMRRRENPGA